MTHLSTVPKLFIGIATLTTTMGTSACATEPSLPGSAVEAIWLNTQDGPTREAIRVFVRQQSGPALIADLNSLTQSPKLVNHKRETRGSSVSRRDFQPIGDYQLMMDNENRCWLIHSLQDVITPLELPNSAACAAYQAP